MVQRTAPARMGGAFGVVLLLGGLAVLIRHAVTGADPVMAIPAGTLAIALGGFVIWRRETLTLDDLGKLALCSTLIVTVAIAARDTPYGAGYAYIWGAPFAVAASRRVGIAHFVISALSIAAAYAFQAAHVDHPVSFAEYASSWTIAVVSVAFVLLVTSVILSFLESTQRELDDGFERGILGMAFLDLGGRYQRVNPALAGMLGREVEDLLGAQFSEFTHPEDQAVSLDALSHVIDRGTAVFDKRYVRPDGSTRWVSVHATILRDEHGVPTRIFAEHEDITARRRAEQAVRDSELRFERAFEDAGVGMLILELDGNIQRANGAAAALFGAVPEEIKGTSIAVWQHPDDREAGFNSSRDLVSDGPADSYRRVARYLRSDGRVVHADATAALVRAEDGQAAYILIQLVDMSERLTARRREAALSTLGQLGLTTESMSPLLKETVRVVAETLDVSHATLLDGDGDDILAAWGWDGEPSRAHARAMLDAPGALVLDHAATELRFPTRALLDAGVITGAAVPIAGEGDAPFGILCVHAIAGEHRFDGEDVAFLESTANVVTAAVRRDAAERELRHRALHDPLTKLPNRALLTDRLRHALSRARREHQSVAALFLDVDDFKDVNDRHGHEGGDALLQALAPRLQGCLRANDTLARFGADEFVVVCEDLADPEEALSVADRLLEACAEPVTIGGPGGTVRRTASIGIALSGGADGDDADTLLRDADLAMHRAKLAGKGRYEVFAHAMRELALDRVAMLNDLDRALAGDELALHFQPIVDIRTGEIISAESLVRWHHPERGLVMPDEFIGLAERTGRIVELGRWVLREAARHAALWPELAIGVNVSRLQLSDPGFVDEVARALGEFGVVAGRFTIEVTETALMEDPAAAETALLALRELGVTISLDDFGTGYSSLSSVSDFPLSTLKLDRAFLADHRPEAQRWSIVRAVLDMARTLELDVIVEGVETETQRARLAELGAIHGQGYLFARPLPAEALSDLLHRGSPVNM
jgi:diguanylate cyclase (GGDEF)-like protein/PAS domain S-box-containing protein